MSTVPTTAGQRPAVARWRRLSRSVVRENVAGFLFISPWIVGFLAFELGPVAAAAYLSLTSYDLLSAPELIGLRNYDRMINRDPLFWHSLRLTGIYALGSVALHVVCGVALALLLNSRIRGLSVYRTVYYLPAVVSGVAVSYMWLWVLNKDAGVLNAALRYVGVEGPNWLFSVEWALPAFILMSLWSVGGGMVLYLAGLQGVPTALYEAAALDGAGWWAKTRHVTVPMISPVIFFNFVMGIIGSFQVFTGAFVMTQGGPANATLFYVLGLYRHAFENFRMGYAAALAMVLFAIIMALTALSFRVSNRLVYYEGQLR
jgi:multiple sugar transport system permease protein